MVSQDFQSTRPFGMALALSRLPRWMTVQGYLRQRDELGTDSGFTQQGYLLPAFTPHEVEAAQAACGTTSRSPESIRRSRTRRWCST